MAGLSYVRKYLFLENLEDLPLGCRNQTLAYISVKWQKKRLLVRGEKLMDDKHFLFPDNTSDGESKLLRRLMYSQIVENAQQGFIIMNCQGKIVDISEYAAGCYGSTRKELLHNYKHNTLRGFTKDYFLGMRTLESGIPFRDHLVSWRVDDKKRSFVIDTMLLRNDQKEKVGVGVLIRDITNMRSVELQIQHNERLAMVAQIAAGAAHEIKNPLTSVRGFLQHLKTSLKKHEMDKELQFTEVMITEIDRVSELLDEFLLLSKPTDLQIEKSKPQELFDDIAEIIEKETMAAGISVKYQIEDTPYIKMDKELIQQVFLNIIHNAIDSMPGGGELSISADHVAPEQVVRFQIKDTGHGIPAYMIDKIFDPFFTTKAGTGLGLAVCQRIVYDHGGNIRVVSKGYGTTFIVNLPLIIKEELD